jgi:hypothetical protein
MNFIAGLDLGQVADYSALVVAERILPPLPPLSDAQRLGLTRAPEPPTTALAYHLRHIQPYPLGTSYPTIVTGVKALLQKLVSRGATILVADATGCGRPVIDMLLAAKLPCLLYAASITGGDTVSREDMHYRIPKRDLASTVQVLLQNAQLKIAEGLPETPTLIKELQDFRMKIDPQTAHDSYSAWRENMHDDLVLATALACWFGEHHREVDLW